MQGFIKRPPTDKTKGNFKNCSQAIGKQRTDRKESRNIDMELVLKFEIINRAKHSSDMSWWQSLSLFVKSCGFSEMSFATAASRDGTGEITDSPHQINFHVCLNPNHSNDQNPDEEQ